MAGPFPGGARTKGVTMAGAQAHGNYPYGAQAMPATREPQLTVYEVVELAKAGVKMDFAEIAPSLIPTPTPRQVFHDPGVDMLLQRMARPWRNETHQFVRMPADPFWIIATSKHGDKVYVFVHARGAEPVTIEDTAELFPSDALLAAIQLLLKTLPPMQEGAECVR